MKGQLTWMKSIVSSLILKLKGKKYRCVSQGQASADNSKRKKHHGIIVVLNLLGISRSGWYSRIFLIPPKCWVGKGEVEEQVFTSEN